MIPRPFVALSLAAVLLAGCGGGKGEANTTTTSTSVRPPSAVKYTFPPRLATLSTADVFTISAIQVSTQDLPADWGITVPARSFEPRPEVVDEVFVQCLFGENPSPLTAYLATTVYVSPDATGRLKSFIRAVGSKPAAAGDFKSFTADRAGDCQDAMYDYEQNPPAGVSEIVGKKFESGPPIGIPVDPLALSDGSRDSIGFRMTIAQNDGRTLYQDVFAYGAGRFETVMLVQSVKAPDSALENSMFTLMKNRTLEAAKKG